jgi:hypothetical protein
MNLTYSELPDFATQVILMEATGLGIKAVCIGVSHKCVKASKSFSFGPQSSLFCAGDYEGWPAAWKLAELIGARDSCGNTDQYQIGSEWPRSAWVREGSHWERVA